MNECMNLRLEITRKKLTYKHLASVLGVSERTLRNKINGASDFTWGETEILHNEVFPETEKSILFAREQDAS